SNFQPCGMNDSSVVLGNAQIALPNGVKRTRAMIWKAGTFFPLGALAGAMDSYAIKIDNMGQVIGTSDGVPFRWTESTGMKPLKSGETILNSVKDLTESGRILGRLGEQWVVWKSETEVEKITFQGPIPDGGYSPFAMNDKGQFLTGITGSTDTYMYDDGTWCKVRDFVPSKPYFLDPDQRLSENGYVLSNYFGEGYFTMSTAWGFLFHPPVTTGSPGPVTTQPAVFPKPPLIIEGPWPPIDLPEPDPPFLPVALRHILTTISVAAAASRLLDSATRMKIEEAAITSAVAQLQSLRESETFEGEEWNIAVDGFGSIWSSLEWPGPSPEWISSIPSYLRDACTYLAMALQAGGIQDVSTRNRTRQSLLEQATSLLENHLRLRPN
ncbi:MAG: hypothetical protein ACREIM_04610, partial [Nitrospiraceae bacterium]